MKIAIIDLGTNTFNLLIFDASANKILSSTKIAVKLGEGGINNNFIEEAPFLRGLQALRDHLETAKQFKADTLYAFATSAIRSATNGADFVQQAAQLGIHVNVIDGATEAELIFKGVKQAIKIPEVPYLVMDIGGGSTEFILAKGTETLWKKSYLLGCSRLLEKFTPSDPIAADEINMLEDYFDEQLEDLVEVCRAHTPRLLVGSSGSFDTLAQMCALRFKTSALSETDTTYTFDLYEYMQMAQLMIKSDIEERLNTPGMIPMRADMIVIACLQINFIVKRLGIKSLSLSTYALKEGVIADVTENQHPWLKSY